jgi:hypothetical protein
MSNEHTSIAVVLLCRLLFTQNLRKGTDLMISTIVNYLNQYFTVICRLYLNIIGLLRGLQIVIGDTTKAIVKTVRGQI